MKTDPENSKRLFRIGILNHTVMKTFYSPEKDSMTFVVQTKYEKKRKERKRTKHAKKGRKKNTRKRTTTSNRVAQRLL